MIKKLRTKQGRSDVNPWIIAVVVSIATFMEVLDTTITNVSLTHIAGTLSATQDESTWVLTSYLVSNGIILPLSGWLADVIGRKRFFLLCIAGFTLASFACGAAMSMGMLVIFRLIQGLAGGGLQPTQQAIILDAFPPEKRGMVFGLTGITLIAAPIIGPVLGGWITDNYNWRWIFFINIPVGILAFILVNELVPDEPDKKAKGFKSVDYIGLGLIALALGSLQIMLDKGQHEDWFDSNLIIGLCCISAASMIFSIFWLLRQEDPVIELRLFKDRSFFIGSILIFLTGFVLYSSSALLPLMVQAQFGYDATLAGLVLSPGAIALVFLMPVAGGLVSHVQSRYLIAIGLVLCSAGMWYTSHVTMQTDYATFTWMRTIQVLGLPFLFIPTSALAFQNVKKEQNNKASALFSLSRNMGGSIGIALVIAYVARKMQVHQNYLVEHLSPYNPVYQDKIQQLSNSFMWRGFTALDSQKLATGSVFREMMNQAAILSYQDAFTVMTGVMMAAALMTLLLPKNNPKANGSAAMAH
ncbi:MAG: oxidoreductase [Rickettsiaceae bacterium]|jgi:DHA2 family multidrug resistance protein|nr:oxidoreductase [Rickettsiaceae bacterium]